MGKKIKTGKSRKDKYYELAKESGYRSRAAFKLLQINRKFEILQSATILIDLCAAPGSWLQVAKQLMPPQHKIIGVDLAPIAAIPTVETFQADITTSACRQTLREMLGHAKANVVLHDGAPNVGTAWSFDEFQQAHLCLQAFGLATEFLVKGGTFVTKVFRSRDYEPLKWVLDQFFATVKVMKPEASRLESAEIYLICLRYRAPDVIDPKFFDHRHVFKDVESSEQQRKETSNNTLINLWHPEKKRRKRDGYDDGDKLYFELKASEFIESSDFLTLLSRANKIVLDKPEYIESANEELNHYFSDIKTLGKAELKKVLKWRKRFVPSKENNAKSADQNTPLVVPKTSEMIAEEELLRLQEEERKLSKKKLKKERVQKRKLATRINLKMVHPGDTIDQVDDIELFSLSQISRQIAAVGSMDINDLAEIDMDTLNPIRKKIAEEENMQKEYDAAAARLDKVGAPCNLEDLPVGPEIGFEKDKAGDMPHKWETITLPPLDEEIDAEPPTKKHRPLTAIERAIAVKLIQSRKLRRELEDESYNRYNFSYDVKEDAPAFLIADERKHARKRPNVTKEEIEAQRPQAVDVKTSKKVEQAKARKRRRILKKQKKITSKLESLPEDLTEKERIMKIREVYKKAGLRAKRKPVNIVVNNRGGGKPAGTVQKGGKTKVVDRRLKADLRGAKKKGKGKGKGKGRGSKQKGPKE